MKIKKDNRGGARVNAGRKKATDPKKPITVYINQSKINEVGGTEKMKIQLLKSI
jgi:hypothetical protein